MRKGFQRSRADRDKLEQILWNLIGNAIKFTPPGGRITVDFQTTPEGFVQTCVADTGCGIDPGHIEKLFNEFSKVPSAIPCRSGGSAWPIHYQKPGDDASRNHLGREHARSRHSLLFHTACRAFAEKTHRNRPRSGTRHRSS